MEKLNIFKGSLLLLLYFVLVCVYASVCVFIGAEAKIFLLKRKGQKEIFFFRGKRCDFGVGFLLLCAVD